MSHYIVPSNLLKTNPPAAEWHATDVPADPTKSFVVVLWDNPNAEVEFEALPGVMPFGDPWSPLPADVAPLAASLQVAPVVAKSGGAAVVVTPDPSAPDTVASALRKMAWPGARLK